jgi:hypothetical protein
MLLSTIGAMWPGASVDVYAPAKAVSSLPWRSQLAALSAHRRIGVATLATPLRHRARWLAEAVVSTFGQQLVTRSARPPAPTCAEDPAIRQPRRGRIC